MGEHVSERCGWLTKQFELCSAIFNKPFLHSWALEREGEGKGDPPLQLRFPVSAEGRIRSPPLPLSRVSCSSYCSPGFVIVVVGFPAAAAVGEGGEGRKVKVVKGVVDLVGLGEVGADVLGHAEGADAVLPEHLKEGGKRSKIFHLQKTYTPAEQDLG